MKEFRKSEKQDIPAAEREKLNELKGNFKDSETAYLQNVGQADNLVAERIKEKDTESEIKSLGEQNPMEQLYSKNWKKIIGHHELSKHLDVCNPNYELGREWKTNCQRCVPTFEMRQRGYDVTAKPRLTDTGEDYLAYHPFDVWDKPGVISCKGNGLSDVKNSMVEWGDGARAQIVVVWRNTNAGHTFSAEQVGGETRFYDPQTGSSDVTKYFENVEPDSVKICRIDNLDVTGKILDCCRKV